MDFYKKHKDWIIPVTQLICFILAIILNVLASTGILNNIGTGEISDGTPTLFTPAGYAFSIWGLIYFALAAYIVYALIPISRRRSNIVVDRVTWILSLNLIFNALWIICWQFMQFWVSFVVIIFMLVTLIAIYWRIDIDYMKNRNRWQTASKDGGVLEKILGTFEYWVYQFTFSIYMGWISVATCANLIIATKDSSPDMSLDTERGFAVGLMVALAFVTLLLLHYRHDVVFCGVAVWALFAIHSNQIDCQAQTAAYVLAWLLLAVGIAVAVLLLYHCVRSYMGHSPLKHPIKQDDVKNYGTENNKNNDNKDLEKGNANDTEPAAVGADKPRKKRSRSRSRKSRS